MLKVWVTEGGKNPECSILFMISNDISLQRQNNYFDDTIVIIMSKPESQLCEALDIPRDAAKIIVFDINYERIREVGEVFLKRWYFWATHSRPQPIIQAAKTIKRHWEGVLSWFDSLITIGLLEGINSLIQAAKARAHGYRTNRNLITMTYFIAGKLKYNLPT